MVPLGRPALAGLLSIAFLAPPAWGQDCTVPIELPDKPQIENFADYNDFVVEIMKYKKKKRAQEAHRKKCPQAYVARKRPNPDPTVIEGPETLSEALRRTQRLPKVDYSRNQKWYDKSTARTFGLPSLSGKELSDRSIDAHLRNLSSAMDPETFKRLSDRERRQLAYEALRARQQKERFRNRMEARDAAREQSKTGGPTNEELKTMALAGADALPPLYARDLRESGKGAGDGLTEQLYYQLLLREQETDEALEPKSRFSDLSYVASTAAVRGQRLDVFIDNGDEPIRFGGLIQVEDCLSSCVPD